MFSEHQQTTGRAYYRPLFFALGLVVIALQLTAMARLAADQVKKAELRDSEISQQRIATAQCFENSFGASPRNCQPQTPLPDRSVAEVKLRGGNPEDTSAFSAPVAGTGLLDVSFGWR